MAACNFLCEFITLLIAYLLLYLPHIMNKSLICILFSVLVCGAPTQFKEIDKRREATAEVM